MSRVQPGLNLLMSCRALFIFVFLLLWHVDVMQMYNSFRENEIVKSTMSGFINNLFFSFLLITIVALTPGQVNVNQTFCSGVQMLEI